MINFIDFNGQIRNFLEQKYNSFYNEDKESAGIKYFEFIEELKNTSLYKIIIGLSFIDNYRLLLDKNKYQKTTIDEKSYLEIYEQITDLDDLLFKILEQPALLSSFIYGSIKFNRLNLKGKASILTQLDDQYVKKFSLFHQFEKYNMFKERTVEEFIYLSKEASQEEKTEIVYKIISILDLLYNYNLKNFSKLILDMIKVYYRFKKVLQHTNPELTFGIDEMIIEIVENNSLDNIVYILSCNSDMISVLVEDFLEYETNPNIEKDNFDALYNRLVPNEIKIKLKEV